jgi:molybdate transport system permease protein
MDWQAFALTLKLATITTAILLCLAIPLAAWLALGRSRWRAVAEAVTGLPLVLPPTVLGFYLLVLLGPRTGLGSALAAMLGHPLAFSFAGLVVGSVIYSLPFAVQPIVAGFTSVDTALIDAARLLGAGPIRLVRTVLLPLAGRSILSGAILCFLHTMGEFGVVLMLGGDIPGATRTLSLVLFNQVESFDYAAANRTGLLLLIFCLVALVAVYARPGDLLAGTALAGPAKERRGGRNG